MSSPCLSLSLEALGPGEFIGLEGAGSSRVTGAWTITRFFLPLWPGTSLIQPAAPVTPPAVDCRFVPVGGHIGSAYRQAGGFFRVRPGRLFLEPQPPKPNQALQRTATLAPVFVVASFPAVAELGSLGASTPLFVNDASSTREFTDAKRNLIRWMLDHGEPEAQQFLPQFERARVTSQRCPCGCASIYFSVEGQPVPTGGFHLLADFVFGGEADLSGIFVYEQGGVLSGLEVYGLAGDAPKTLPTPDLLRPSPFAAAST